MTKINQVMKRIVSALHKLSWANRAYTVLGLCAATAMALSAQTFTTLHSFDGTDGADPYAGIVQGTNGEFYGTTDGGGATNYGTVFKMTRSGSLTTLDSFCNQYGCTAVPSGLVQATNGDFYGTSIFGGINNAGTVFKIKPGGTLTTLYSFCSKSGCGDGQNPDAQLVQATSGDFYGTTNYGGVDGNGTVFKITPNGALTTLYRFCSQAGCMDGAYPTGALTQATNGDFYGTTLGGGDNGFGTVFKITPSGALTTLHRFCSLGYPCVDGSGPFAGLIQATDGDFYGTTVGGGGPNLGGTVFRIAPNGTLTTLYSFCSQSGCPDGESPDARLIQATNGDFYGTTDYGGANDNAACLGFGTTGCGTIFEITRSGNLTTLYSFCSLSGCADGDNPYYAALVQDTNGDFYGTTEAGGANNDGTVFSLSAGLGPFVKTQPPPVRWE